MCTWMPMTLLAAVLLGTLGLGGGVYETLLVDPVWPRNPQLIQPRRGGINRKLFWAPIQGLFELTLLVSLWTFWNDAVVRWWIVFALASHTCARLWSFLYFIPAAIQFENLDDFGPDQAATARRWTRLSVWRLPLEAASVVALCRAVVAR